MAKPGAEWNLPSCSCTNPGPQGAQVPARPAVGRRRIRYARSVHQTVLGPKLVQQLIFPTAQAAPAGIEPEAPFGIFGHRLHGRALRLLSTSNICFFTRLSPAPIGAHPQTALAVHVQRKNAIDRQPLLSGDLGGVAAGVEPENSQAREVPTTRLPSRSSQAAETCTALFQGYAQLLCS